MVQVPQTREHRFAEAIRRDHPNCSSRSCDIAAALRNGFIYVAAFLLQGSTETPSLDALTAYEPLPLRKDNYPMGWALWVKFFKENSIQCIDCHAFNFTDLGPMQHCANCLKPLPNRREGDK